MIKKHKLLYICITLLLYNIFAISQSKADEYFSTIIYPEDKAVFAFFRAAKDAPDFDTWIKNGERYKSSPKENRRIFLIKEKLRLGYGFGRYDNDKNLLELSINILAKYIPKTEGEEEGGAQPRIIFSIPSLNSNQTPTFNYPYGNDFISLIIKKLQLFSDLQLNEIQNNAIIKKVPYEDDVFDATLKISVRIDKADTDKPIEIGRINQWIMMGKIAYLKCEIDQHYNGTEYTLWDYIAPWYEEEFRIKNIPERLKYPHPYDLFKD